MPNSSFDEMLGIESNDKEAEFDAMISTNSGESSFDEMLGIKSTESVKPTPKLESEIKVQDQSKGPDFSKSPWSNTIQGRLMSEYFQTGSVPDSNLINTENIKSDIVDIVSGFSNLVSSSSEPIDYTEDGAPIYLPATPSQVVPTVSKKLARGAVDFFSAIPGFLIGVAALPDRIKFELMSGDKNAEELYDATMKDIEGVSKATRERMVDPLVGQLLGESSPGSEMVGATVMAPLIAISKMSHSVADWKRFEDSPNTRGVIKFGGDIVGLMVLGRLYHKGKKGEVVQDVNNVVRKANDIKTKTETIEQLPVDDAIRVAQERLLELEKQQLEVESKALMDKLDYGQMVIDDLSNKGGRVKQIKARQKDLVDVQVDKAMKRIKDKPREKVIEEDLQLIKDIEETYSKPIDKITDAEIEDYYTKLYEEPVDAPMIERESVELSTEQSPFRTTREETQRMTQMYEERVKNVQSNPELFSSKLINDVNRWLDGEKIPIEDIRNGLSEMAGRAEEIRDYFREGEGYPSNFDNWKEAVSEAASWARKAEKEIKGDQSVIAKATGEEMFGEPLYEISESPNPADIGSTITKHWKKDKPDVKLKLVDKDGEIKLYDIGGATAQGAKQLIKGAKDFAKYLDDSRAMKRFKPIEALKRTKEEGIRTFIDKMGNIRERFLQDLGPLGYETMQKAYLSKGASSRSADMLKQLRKEVYRGLSKSEIKILDGIILADRMSDIAKYKRGYKFPKYISSDGKLPNKTIVWRETFKDLYKLSDKKAVDLLNRSKAYFEWMKKPLQDMKDAGLISQAEMEALASHNYRRIKLVDIYDKRYQAKVGKSKRTVYDSGIESLSRGRVTDIYEPSSEIMALEVFNRAYGRILNNEANLNLLEIARRIPDNDFVRVKEGKQGSVPNGWDRLFLYEDGQRKAIHISPELSKEWIINSSEMSYKMSQIARYASLSPVLRTFATGIDWGFAMANLPRDVMHTWFTARAWEDGKWKPVYNPTFPIFAGQMTRDVGTVFTDAMLRKGRYKDYINQGGGMEFLVHQGRIFQRGRHIDSKMDRLYDFLGYLGETSELLTRLAIRERAIRKGKDPREATFIARDYMDFGQGGGVTKALDNGFPYLNAAVQGTRGLFRSFKPGSGSVLESTYKLSQLATITTGLYIASQRLAPETMEELKGNRDTIGNLIIPLGDDFAFEDEYGQTRYPYIKIPIDPGQRFFKKFFEAASDKWMGNEVDVEGTVEALKELTPADVTSLPPSISGAIGYITNKDFWLNEDIWRKTDPFTYPRSKEEFDRTTPQMYIDIGEATGLSPERTRYAIEEIVTSGSMWNHLVGLGYDKLLADLPREKKQQHLAMILDKAPLSSRFFGVTNPYSKYAEKAEKFEEIATVDEFIKTRNFDTLVDDYLYGEETTRADLVKGARSHKDRDTYDRLMDRLKFEEGIKNLPERSFWRRMKGMTLEARAKLFVDRLKGSDEEERKQLWQEYRIISRAGGVVSEGFREEVRKKMVEDN